MFKLLLLLFLGWLAFRMMRAGKVVMGIVRGVEQVMREANGEAAPVPPEAPEGEVTVRRHPKEASQSYNSGLQAEDVPFKDV